MTLKDTSTPASARLCAAAALSAVLAGGCAGGVSSLAAAPELTPIQNPAAASGDQRVSMPLPAPRAEPASPNSLWRSGARSFFDDQRATQIGDILTVNIEIADSAQVNNSTQRARNGSETGGVSAFLGLNDKLNGVLPGTPGLDPAVSFNSTSSASGSGSVNRAETVRMKVAAVITDRLPNGNLVIGGSQEVRINAELRELFVTGVIRPQDIGADNTIPYSKIAEARISYGGRGDISSAQRARYGQRVYDKVSPF
ncbi:flagellar basal body L-ring protein FlgH [bacterium]|nr:flagellar basal body L-ring protein FlgH [bacterium]